MTTFTPTVEVRLHGDLSRFLPEVQSFAVHTIRELVSALESQLEGFYSYIRKRASEGASYHILVNGKSGVRDLGESNLSDPLGNVRVDIIPVIEGSGNWAKIVAGVVLIAVGIWTGGVGFVSGSALIMAGTSLALSGFIGLFTPPVQNANEDEKKRSLVFSSAINSAPNNSRVPVILGCGWRGKGVRVGSLVVEQQIRSFSVEE